MIVENLLPLLLIGAMIFGVLWLAIEGAAKVGDLLGNRRGSSTR